MKYPNLTSVGEPKARTTYACLVSKLETDRVILMTGVGGIYTLDSEGAGFIDTFSQDMACTR